VQELKSYASDLCECLAAKAALGEELEDHLAEMREERGRAEAGARQVRGAARRGAGRGGARGRGGAGGLP
jgi:hypothetical protein